jgi:hypothetical protein
MVKYKFKHVSPFLGGFKPQCKIKGRKIYITENDKINDELKDHRETPLPLYGIKIVHRKDNFMRSQLDYDGVY